MNLNSSVYIPFQYSSFSAHLMPDISTPSSFPTSEPRADRIAENRAMLRGPAETVLCGTRTIRKQLILG